MATGFSTFKSGVKLGAGQKLGFTAGKGYYARGGAPAAGGGGAAGADPFALLTPGQIANQIAGYTAKLPAPMTGPQIQQQASDELSPIVASLTSQFQNATKAGTDSIAGYSKTLADQLAQEIGNVQATYGGAEQAQAAADNAEAQGVKDTGTGLAANLAGKFAQMGAGADASNVGLSPVTAGATGAGNALLGHGSAALSALIGEGAAQGAYTAKLPGIAGQQGLQDIANLTASNQKNLADATTQVESKLPDIVNALTSRSDTNAANRVQLAREVFNELTGQNLSKAAAQAAVAKLQQTGAYDSAKLGISQQNADTAARRASLEAQRTQDASARGWASIGIQTKREQAAAKAAEAKLRSGGFTPAQVAKFNGTALTLAENVYQGFTNSKGVAHPPLTYKDAMLEARKEGIPATLAMKALNQFYKPGEKGRPLTKDQAKMVKMLTGGLISGRTP